MKYLISLGLLVLSSFVSAEEVLITKWCAQAIEQKLSEPQIAHVPGQASLSSAVRRNKYQIDVQFQRPSSIGDGVVFIDEVSEIPGPKPELVSCKVLGAKIFEEGDPH